MVKKIIIIITKSLSISKSQFFHKTIIRLLNVMTSENASSRERKRECMKLNIEKNNNNNLNKKIILDGIG